MDFSKEFEKKLVSPDTAAKLVKSGDRIMIGEIATVTPVFEAALARRYKELKDIVIYCDDDFIDFEMFKLDPNGEHFTVADICFSTLGRKYSQEGKSYYHLPMLYHEITSYYRALDFNVACVPVTPMDENGYFNFGPTGGNTSVVRSLTKKLVVEINETLPYCYGKSPLIHISDIDYIIKGNNQPLLALDKVTVEEEDKLIANHIVNLMEDGMVIQLGIGKIPNYVGELIARSDLKDLGIHTEMMCDSFMNLCEAGKITNSKKTLHKGKSIYTFALGSKKLYDWLDHNEDVLIYPVEYVNNPLIISQNDKVCSICGCVNIDLYGQVSSESYGAKQISTTGGQLDFIYASYHSKGGKGFVCTNSVKKGKDGRLVSNIVPTFAPYTTVTLPRSISYYLVTEYGAVNLKGKTTWERAEAVISIAHPDFRDGLIKEAEKMNIWRKTNKI
ncbi:MAG: acetyl-CoA hydrolase/transferase C-terminal domain-containing protein [Lachnospiraceae bacterium]|nr:acetyl-CoA hydrolase/transferase C-terminal domain-containing protein [Lachnospiraceae bacterium]